MKTTVRHIDGDVTVLELEGNLNMANAGAVREAIAALVRQGHHRVVVDLAAVPFLDSFGLGSLVGSLQAARQAGGDLRIAAPGEQVRQVLSLTNVDRVLTPYATPEQAYALP